MVILSSSSINNTTYHYRETTTTIIDYIMHNSASFFLPSTTVTFARARVILSKHEDAEKSAERTQPTQKQNKNNSNERNVHNNIKARKEVRQERNRETRQTISLGAQENVPQVQLRRLREETSKLGNIEKRKVCMHKLRPKAQSRLIKQGQILYGNLFMAPR